MKVRYTETANREAHQLLTTIAADNAVAAAHVAATIEAAIARLSQFPHLGAKTDTSPEFTSWSRGRTPT
jgi:plasmid stabilization system protein ParE